MKTNRSFIRQGWFGLAPLMVGMSLCAAPLTWFPGPSLDYADSAAATVVMPGYGNVVIGGDFSEYAEGLIATNLYWTPLTMPLWGTFIAPGAVVSGGQIILFGGTDGTASTSAAINYSSSDGATTLASMSVPRSYLGYAGDRSGNAYAIGGLDDTGQPLASGEKLTNPDGGSGAWTKIASLPLPRFDFPAVFDRTNFIYIFGGYNDTLSGVESASVMRYSISKNTWTNLASLPVAVAGSCATLGADGKFYVVGGLSGGGATNVVQVYNSASNSWTISTPLPESLSASVMGADSLGRLIVMGGMDTNGYDTSDVWRSQQLGAPDTLPVLTQLPATNATYLGTYNSPFTAIGNPQPVYLLVNGPAGMTVDYNTGAINWTPTGVSQIGSIPVTVAATNFAGATNFSFAIQVPNPRPIYPTNLVVTNITENSATLLWNAADLIYGAVTYSLAIPHPYHSPKGSGGGVNYEVIASGITGTNVTITGLKAGASTTFDISVTGPGGSTGFGFVGFYVTTLPAPPPANFRVTALTSTTVGLAWDAPVGQFPVVSYSISGWFNGIAAQYPLGFVNIPGTSFTVTNLAPGGAMLWSVSATDSAGNVSLPTYLPALVINPVPHPVALAASAASASLNGGFQFTIQPSAAQTTLIQATTNPLDPTSWTTIFTNPISGGPLNFTDCNACLFPLRFYRVVTP